jgi:energy-coupling factor transport system permease protein
VKLLLTVELFALSLLSNTIYEIISTLAVILILASVARILPRIYRTLLLSLGFSLFIFVVNYLVGYSLFESAILAARFISIIASTSIFFLTTSPDELEQVMKWFKVPQDIVFAFVTAVRFVPVLMLDALQIMDAQKSRGLELDRGNVFTRIKKFVPILIPLVVSAVIRSSELAEAMEARAYGAVKKTNSLYILNLRMVDKVCTIASTALFVLGIYLYLLKP